MKNLIKTFLLISVMILTGCSTPLVINIQSASHLNPDDQNRSLPVEVVVYQLQDDQVFRQATFQELWQNDQATLGNSLLSRREINIPPNSKMKIKLPRNQETTYIGALAIFRNPQNGSWRTIKKIGKGVPLTAKHLVIYLQGDHVRFK